MLTPQEQTLIDAAARAGETAVGIEFMRHLAKAGRIGEIADVISAFYRGAEVNKAPLRAFLAGRVPAILANHYLPGATDRARLGAWTASEPAWGAAVEAAASACSPDRLRVEVERIRALIAAQPVADPTAARG